MQEGNIYSVHKNSNGFCTKWGEFETLEEANECFYKLVREELEERNPNHQHYFHIYMLYWSRDHSWHKTIRVWDIEKGYTTDFPREPKSKFKILKQFWIKHKVLKRRSKMTHLESLAKDCIENHTHKLVDKPTKQDIYLREESIYISGYKECKRKYEDILRFILELDIEYCMDTDCELCKKEHCIINDLYHKQTDIKHSLEEQK